MRIVVVEDEVRTRISLVNCIKKLNPQYQVVAYAENGYEGMQVIRDYEPDVVITDIRMPKIDGLRMIEQLKNINLNPYFIILSGYAEFDYAKQGMRLGVIDYLLKPITVKDLKETLEKVEKSSAVVKPDRNLPYSELVKDMITVIEKEFGKHLGLDKFARKYKMAPEYLSSLFAKETGKTISNYIREVRIERAKILLMESDLKIYEIACQVGYPDQKYFSKVFKEYAGVSAKQYSLTND